MKFSTKNSIIFGMLFSAILLASTLAKATNESPLECKPGFREVARCAAIKVIAMPEPKNTLTEELAESTLALYQDILTCRRNGSVYVQTNVYSPREGNSFSPEHFAKLSSTGATSRVIFDTDDHSSSSIIFGGFAGARGNGNGQLVVDYRTNRTSGKKIDRFVYAVQCDYQR